MIIEALALGTLVLGSGAGLGAGIALSIKASYENHAKTREIEKLNRAIGLRDQQIAELQKWEEDKLEWQQYCDNLEEQTEFLKLDIQELLDEQTRSHETIGKQETTIRRLQQALDQEKAKNKVTPMPQGRRVQAR